MRGLALLLVRRARWVVAATVALLAVAGGVGFSAESHLSTGGFTDPSWESSRAQSALIGTFHSTQPNLLLLVTASSGSVTDPAVAADGTRISQRLAQQPGVVGVASFWSRGDPTLRSTDGRQALIAAVVTGDENSVRDAAKKIAADFDGSDGTVSVSAGGSAEIAAEIADQSAKDLSKADTISLPITALLLLLLFGSAVGASLPLVVGGVAIVGTLFLLRLLTGVTDVSVFALNVTTGLGLGLGVDYSLLIVTRYREELRSGRTAERALVRTLETAGRTVLFSGVTVAIALASLAIFPIAFLRSFAYAGIGVVALAALAAVVVLPAVLHLLGPRIERGRLWKRRAGGGADRFWYDHAHRVMRRPVLFTLVVVAVLLVMGAPFTGITLGDDDERILPTSASAHVVGDALRSHFDPDPAWTLSVVAPNTGAASSAALSAYASSLSALDGVARVDAATGHYAHGQQIAPADATAALFTRPGASWLQLTASAEPLSPPGEHLVTAIRSTPSPFPVLVGGSAATLVDSRDSMLAHLPLAITVIVVATFVLLFLMVGSVLVPLKTLLLNIISLSATFGALVFVFQHGHLASPLDFTATGTISIRTPVLLFCFAFGLSMDYEVFLISRIKEEYDRLGDNEEAVAQGLQHTGRLVTSAALLISVVFLAFLTSGVTTIKTIGLGLALAVLVDAFLVRATLVPALMRLLGDRNWWAPRRLRRLHLLVGIWEREPLAILDVGVPVHLDRAPLLPPGGGPAT